MEEKKTCPCCGREITAEEAQATMKEVFEYCFCVLWERVRKLESAESADDEQIRRHIETMIQLYDKAL